MLAVSDLQGASIYFVYSVIAVIDIMLSVTKTHHVRIVGRKRHQ